jgi:lipoprotein-anchoring transpeptidase ErfK/SrfK
MSKNNGRKALILSALLSYGLLISSGKIVEHFTMDDSNVTYIDDNQSLIDAKASNLAIKIQTPTTITKYVYLKNDTTLYDENGNDIGFIGANMRCVVLQEYGNNSYISCCYNDIYTEGFVNTNNLFYEPDDVVVINLENQTISIKNGEVIELQGNVVTGSPNTPTPTGIFNVKYKTLNTYLIGRNNSYKVPVDYWINFTNEVTENDNSKILTNNAYGIHDMQTRNSFGQDEFGTNINSYNGSHGCVNVPLDVVKIIWDYTTPSQLDNEDNIITPGTTVIICNPNIITKEYRMQK